MVHDAAHGCVYANSAVKGHWGSYHAPDWNTEAAWGRKAKGDRQGVLLIFHTEVLAILKRERLNLLIRAEVVKQSKEASGES